MEYTIKSLKTLLLGTFLCSLFSCAPSGDIDNYSDYFVVEDSLSQGSISVTFFGVSTLLFDDSKSQILIDGFFTRPSTREVLFRKLRTNHNRLQDIIDEYQINNLEAVFTSHTHYDHALDAADISKMTSAQLLGSKSTLNLGRGVGLIENEMDEFNLDSIYKFACFDVQVFESKHSPPKLLNDDLGEEIKKPISKGARFYKYKEGGSFDFLITHGALSFYVKSSPNFIENALDSLEADVLFLGTGSIGDQKDDFLKKYYDENVLKLKPTTLIPIHWDNFLESDFENLEMMPRYMDKGARTFDYLIKRSEEDGIDFKILKGGKKMYFE